MEEEIEEEKEEEKAESREEEEPAPSLFSDILTWFLSLFGLCRKK